MGAGDEEEPEEEMDTKMEQEEVSKDIYEELEEEEENKHKGQKHHLNNNVFRVARLKILPILTSAMSSTAVNFGFDQVSPPILLLKRNCYVM